MDGNGELLGRGTCVHPAVVGGVGEKWSGHRKTLSQGSDNGRQSKMARPAAVSGTDHFVGGRYWVRTSDLFGVNEARYHCANRPDAIEC